LLHAANFDMRRVRERAKVFCFFFSKKKTFLFFYLLHPTAPPKRLVCPRHKKTPRDITQSLGDSRMLNQTFRALLLTAGLAAATPASAGTASFLVVHGIPGRDVAATLDPALPVDVLINGSLCLLKNLTFGEIAGPYDVPTGTYTVAVSLANPISPCSNSPVISASVALTDGEFGAIVAQLSSAGAPTAGVYPVDVSAVGTDTQRFVAVHAADAPAVSLGVVSNGKATEKFEIKLQPGATGTHTTTVRESFLEQVLAGNKLLAPTGTGSVGNQSVLFSAIVGNASTGSVTILSKQLRAVH